MVASIYSLKSLLALGERVILHVTSCSVLSDWQLGHGHHLLMRVVHSRAVALCKMLLIANWCFRILSLRVGHNKKLI
jgi:hypothetical protein